MLSGRIIRCRKLLLCALMISMVFGMKCPAETISGKVTSAEKERLTELGYLAEDRYSEDEAVAAAIRDFKMANGLSENEENSEVVAALLMSENARSQSEYLSAKAQSLHEQGMLSLGAFGEPVKNMQLALAELGYFEDECNGAFNETTEMAVKRFQLACGLNVTGVADSSVFLRLYEGEPKTYNAFLEQMSCQCGDTGDNVRTLQVWLKKIGFSGFSVTGSYGALTTRAVKAYQKANDLEETGVVDIVTARKITEDCLCQVSDYRSSETAPDHETLLSLLKENGQDLGSGSKDQIKLDLMKYQFQRGLPVTGEADEETVRALRNGVLPVTRDEPVDVSKFEKIAKAAYDMVGTQVDFDSYYGFPEFINLKFEKELPKESEVHVEQLSDITEAEPGDTVMIVEADRILWGIRAEKSGILCEIDGVVVLYYPDSDVSIFRVVQ